MAINALINNLALLLALGVLFSLLVRTPWGDSLRGKIIMGLLFGITCLIVMQTPMTIPPDLIFDTRSVVLSLAGLIGGPIAATIAIIIGGSYRIYLGGIGALAGTAGIIWLGVAGCIYRQMIEGKIESLSPIKIYLFGLVVQLGHVSSLLLLPNDLAWPALNKMFLPMMIVYPLGIVTLGVLLTDVIFRLDSERKLKASEKQLKVSEGRFRGIVDSMADWMWEVDSDGRYTYCSEKVENILGYTPDEMLGKKPFDFMPEDESEKIGEFFSNIVAQKGRLKDLENWNIKKDGSHVCLLTNGVPILNKNDELLGFRGVDSDITMRKLAEAEKIRFETKLQQTQKMESIGTLAGGIAHDFNNILFPILGHSEMLLEDAPKDSPFKESLNEIYTGALRAKELVQQILTFSRQEDRELKLMKMQPIIKEALKFIRSTIPTTIDIKQNIQADCGVIKADPTQIHQVIMNLTTNSYHAMRDTGGELKVSLKAIELGEYDLINSEMTPGDYACLKFADTGIGMDKEISKKIFDPFFTTKKKNEGTGMGLSVVHGIVNSMRGAIQVYSEPGKGTEFTVYIPVEKKSSEINKRQVKQSIPGGTEHVLLVDDEESIISMEKQMLERLGYKVTSYTSSTEALEVFRNKPESFDIIISDIAMPNLSGDKLALELIKICSDIPILLCTGFSENMTREKAESLGIRDFLVKPVIKKVLAQKIREALSNN